MPKHRQGDILSGRVRRVEIGNLPGPHPFGKSLSLQSLAPSHDATFPVHPILAVWAYPSYILFPSLCQVNSETTSPIHYKFVKESKNTTKKAPATKNICRS